MTQFLARRIWQTEETLALLDSYRRQTAGLEYPINNKVVLQNVLHDLQSQGVLTQPTTVVTINSKIRNLISKYKIAKEEAKRTLGTDHNQMFIPFQEELEHVFGDRLLTNGEKLLNKMGCVYNELAATYDDDGDEQSIPTKRHRTSSPSEDVEDLENNDIYELLEIKTEATEDGDDDDDDDEDDDEVNEEEMRYTKKLVKQKKKNSKMTNYIGKQTSTSTASSSLLTKRPNTQQIMHCGPANKQKIMDKYLAGKLSLLKEYLNDKLEMKKRVLEDKQKRHREKMAKLDQILKGLAEKNQ